MKAILDKSMLRQVTIDSGSLTAMGSIIHRLAEQGEYRGIVYRGTAKGGTFSLSVCDYVKTDLSDEALAPRQAAIDLSVFDGSSGSLAKDYRHAFTLQTGGHIIFSVPTGFGEYAIELFRREKKKDPVKVFDSRLLCRGDIFVTHVMRPGSYLIRNIRGKGHADLTVEYPEPGKLTGNMEPVLVECKDRTIHPAAVKIQPVQVLMFSCSTQESRITIELKKADDRPRPVRAAVIAPAALQRKEKPAKGVEKTILRKIRFFG